MNIEGIDNLLARIETIAVVGVSNKPDRASYQVAKYLLEETKYKVYFVNPMIEEIFGQKVYKSLEELNQAVGEIDIVDVFRNIGELDSLLTEAIAIKAKCFWMQLGLASDQIASRGEVEGLTVIQDKCIKIEFEKISK